MSNFKKAERRRSKLRLWLSGMSSSGKTLTSLMLAKGFGGKIAMIDTEAGRGEMYGSQYEYDVLQLTSPFTPESYITAIKEAEEAGYECLVIDSMSHEWKQILSEKTKMDERGGNSFTNWGKFTNRHDAMLEAISQSKIPFIAMTCRVKRDYIMETNDKGKQAPRLVGLANVQRDGAEYDLTIEWRLDKNHEAEAIKDNTGHFLNKSPLVLNEEHGKLLKEWHSDGKEAVPHCVRCTSKKSIVVDSIGLHEASGHELCAECVKAWDAKVKADKVPKTEEPFPTETARKSTKEIKK